MSKGFASNYRIVLLAALVILCFGAIGTRLVFLHVIDRQKYLAYVDKARRQVSIEKGRRGDIVDTRGDILATSRSTIILAVDPQVIGPEDPVKWHALATLINIPYADLLRIFTTKTRALASASTASAFSTSTSSNFQINFDTPTPAAPASPNDTPDANVAAATAATAEADDAETGDIDETTHTRLIRWAKLADQISETTFDEIQKLKIKGIIGTRVYRRSYPHNQLAAHIIGYVNKEGIPAAGTEAYSNQWLFGADGWRESEKDAHQRELAQFRTREISSNNGYTIKLSIDSVVQNWAEEELDTLAKKYSPKHATIIVSDAQTGFIRALANYPSFNLNEYGKVQVDVMKNYAITDQIDPGSTFKIVAASGALQDKLVTPETRFDCSSEYVDYQNRHLHLIPDDHHWDHPLPVAEIISHSSNRGAAQLAMKLGDQRFYEYARAFGFGEKTGFPFGGEIRGVLNPPEKWSGIDITRIPAGYSISATPMQIHYAMATIASGGELLLPQIISEIRDSNGELIYQFHREVRRRVISPETAATMQTLLRGVVSPDGTAGKIFMPGYQLAGKTGTAQKLIDGRYSKTNHVGSFVGFFPASNPRLVISVIVDDATVPGNAAAYGATVAAPSFRRIAERLIPYYDIQAIPEAGPAPTRAAPRTGNVAATR